MDGVKNTLVKRHVMHGDLIHVFGDSNILSFFKKKVLDEVYAKLREES